MGVVICGSGCRRKQNVNRRTVATHRTWAAGALASVEAMARAAAVTSLGLRLKADRRGHDPSPCGGNAIRIRRSSATNGLRGGATRGWR
eukprot:11209267-Heterocapsa_arctica.AAC.1